MAILAKIQPTHHCIVAARKLSERSHSQGKAERKSSSAAAAIVSCPHSHDNHVAQDEHVITTSIRLRSISSDCVGLGKEWLNAGWSFGGPDNAVMSNDFGIGATSAHTSLSEI